MDPDVGSLPQQRVADAIPHSGLTLARAAGDYHERTMPVGAAILWTPVGQVAADPAYPIFISQRALDAVHSQLAALPDGASSLGFLVGGMYQAPDTHAPYIVVESTIHLPWSIAGDHLEAALRQGRIIAQEEARRRGSQLLGWYHSHVAAHARLSVSDVEAHVACFDQPWHVALVVARGAELTGGVFRIASRAAWSADCLPFYELPEEGVHHLTWANYHTREVALSGNLVSLAGLVAQAGDAGPPLMLFPDDDVDPDMLPPPPPPARRYLPAPVAKVARVGAVGLLAGTALFGAYRVLGVSGNGAPSPEAAAVATPEALDRLADTVAFSVTAFEIRLRLFDSKKMNCTDVARGLMDLESRWIAHNAARKGTAATLDSARVARDRRLNADVGVVERGFARTGCPRP